MREIMTIKLIATQVPDFWELIKYSLEQVERIGDVYADKTYNRLLAELLSDKAQCFIVYDESGEVIKAVCLTVIFHDVIRDVKTLHIRSLYAFKASSNDTWKEEFEVVRKFAINEGCNNITLETSNSKVKSIAKHFGAVETSTNMTVGV